MRLINVQVEFVSLFELQHARQIEDRAFHRVQPLDNHNDLFPWPVRPWLALAYAFTQQRLESIHASMLEWPDAGPAHTHT